jgi:hypothetical protein
MNLEWNWCPPLAPDEPGVEQVSIFNLMTLEWNWCPPLADEPGGELVPTVS